MVAEPSIEKDVWQHVGSPIEDPHLASGDSSRRPFRFRDAPSHYFLPRRSALFTVSITGGALLAGTFAGILVAQWIQSKVQEDSKGTVVVVQPAGGISAAQAPPSSSSR
eukprot:TRINITY_DN3806_c0_g1_i1.p1 TRINITY_DN3806_c0_g1~~TRINITY_DN3806_c0_g1_i1.p1  ORF type:complete len:109 (-),score=10.30 TRINITY_DN3806_c0_g1_i1:791-1117(-)